MIETIYTPKKNFWHIIWAYIYFYVTMAAKFQDGLITCDCTAATATGDTTETSMGTVTLPANAKKIIGVGVSVGGAGTTTLEGVTGIFRVIVNSLDVAPAKFPFGLGIPLASGVTPTEPKVWAVDWEPAGNAAVQFLVTMDMTQTINPTARGFVVYEK